MRAKLQVGPFWGRFLLVITAFIKSKNGHRNLCFPEVRKMAETGEGRAISHIYTEGERRDSVLSDGLLPELGVGVSRWRQP